MQTILKYQEKNIKRKEMWHALTSLWMLMKEMYKFVLALQFIFKLFKNKKFKEFLKKY